MVRVAPPQSVRIVLRDGFTGNHAAGITIEWQGLCFLEEVMPRLSSAAILLSMILLIGAIAPIRQARAQDKVLPPAELAEFFRPPAKYRNDLGSFRSPLKFNDGSPVKTAQDWQRRRTEILDTWHKAMGPWPALIDDPKVETVKTTRRENVTQHQLRLGIALDGEMVDAFLLVPDGKGPFPAVVVVYYDAQTGVGLGTKDRDYGWHLAKRGFVVLSIGRPGAGVNLDDAGKAKGTSYLGPAGKAVRVEPLSALAYVAANANTWLARRADVIAAHRHHRALLRRQVVPVRVVPL